MMAWARAADVREKIANVPLQWLYGFANAHPADVRKFGVYRNGTLLYRVDAVLAAIEQGEGYDNCVVQEVAK